APGADGEAQARTAAKTLADLRAADDASRGPAPYVAPARMPHDAADTPPPVDTPEAAPAESDNADGDTNQQVPD
uniref:hypothetical protein n=1 Tax=Sphingomonas bacterium TaxID=1895847 RepID=UPI001C2DDF0A